MTAGDGSDRGSAGDRLRRGVRYLGRFVALNGSRTLRDAAVVVGWASTLVLVFVRIGGPRWAFDLVLLAGIVAYLLRAEPLESPDREG